MKMFAKIAILLPLLVVIGIEVESKELPRMKRQQSPGGHVASGAAMDVGTGFLTAAIESQVVPEQSSGCAYRWGCHRGYCWAGCDATAFNNEWCYTTRGYSQDFQYVGCGQDSDCERCWACAGSCTA